MRQGVETLALFCWSYKNYIPYKLPDLRSKISIVRQIFLQSCIKFIFQRTLDNIYRQPCVATRRLCFTSVYFYLFFFIQLSFSETTGPILTKFSGIVYSGVV